MGLGRKQTRELKTLEMSTIVREEIFSSIYFPSLGLLLFFPLQFCFGVLL